MAIEKDLTALELLGVAIRAEIDAQGFYKAMAKRIKNRVVKERILGLAGDELGHERLLKRIYTEWSGEENPPIPDKGPVPLSELINDKMSHEQVLETAIAQERAAVDRYIEAAKKAQDDSGRRVLQYLSEFERTHERMLTSELEYLRKNEDWFEEDTFPGSDRPTHLGP
jgi:rubrerythrin